VAYYRSGYGPDDFPSEDVSIQSTWSVFLLYPNWLIKRSEKAYCCDTSCLQSYSQDAVLGMKDLQMISINFNILNWSSINQSINQSILCFP
jgi:hypothetical protein